MINKHALLFRDLNVCVEMTESQPTVCVDKNDSFYYNIQRRNRHWLNEDNS